MKKYEVILLGPQCSGKTTLARYLRARFSLPILEEDEVFTKLNNGTYPTDIHYKETILRPKIEEEIKNANSIIFLTSYIDPQLLKDLKARGFKVVQLMLGAAKFHERNEKRMKTGYDDARKWLDENLEFHKKVRDQGLVDIVINADRPIEIVAKEFMDFAEK